MVEINEQALDDYVAHLPKVRAAVIAIAQDILAGAQARAMAHRDDGDLAASISMARGRADAYVYSTDPNVLSKEYGHTDKRTGRRVEGIHVIGGAAADVAGRR